MFNIPMNTKGALSADSLMSLNNVGAVSPQTQPIQNMQPQMPQAQPTQNMQPQMPQAQPMQSTQPQTPYTQPVQNTQPQTSYQMPQTQPVAPKQRPTGTGVHLKKGQKTSLSQMNPNLSEIQVCLGWDISNQACDLDASAFMLGDDNKVVGDDWFVFYGQPVSPDGSIIHHGDSCDGAVIGDDEVIDIKLNQINQMVKKIAFVITINEARENNLNFSMVSNAYVRVLDKSTGKELVKFLLTDYFSNVTSMVVGEVYNKGGQWRFNPVGNGFAEDLAGLCNVYGVNVAD
ncbi:MAG: TerD family protein [Acutalibacteraceae bacterium]|nr:TerD family protein [Acutalibacteraceae bacterium]